jgi:hypothetical protein
MSNSKNKAKKQTKKEHVHEIPLVKTAKGRRPHTEEKVEPYQPSLLSETDLKPQRPAKSVEPEKREEAIHAEAIAAAPTEAQEEVILEGRPEPESKRTKIDLKEQIENVKGVVQMGTAIVKSSFPKPFELAEKVVEDWTQDGDFSELPINQPLVQFYVGLGLRKVKQTEKELEQKLETTGVLPVVRQQWQKAQKLFK